MLGEFFDLLGFFGEGDRESGRWVGFFKLVLEVGDHFLEFGDI